MGLPPDEHRFFSPFGSRTLYSILKHMRSSNSPPNQLTLLLLISITGSSEHELNNVVQNYDKRSFSWSIEDILLMMASSSTDFNIYLDRNDETRNSGNFEHGVISTSRSNCYRKTHTHHRPHQTFDYGS